MTNISSITLTSVVWKYTIHTNPPTQTNQEQMLTLHLLWQRIKLRESEPVTNGFYAPLVYCASCPLATEQLGCQSIVSSLGNPFQHPRFALYTVPGHCLETRCPLSQTGMTLGTLPAAQVEMSGGLAVWGSDKQIMPCLTREVGRAGKACRCWNCVQ